MELSLLLCSEITTSTAYALVFFLLLFLLLLQLRSPEQLSHGRIHITKLSNHPINLHPVLRDPIHLNTVLGIEQQHIILECPQMHQHPQLLRLLQSGQGTVGLVVPQQAIGETDSSGVLVNVGQVEPTAAQEVISRQLAVGRPVLDSPIVEAVQPDRAFLVRLCYGRQIMFAQGLQYGLADFKPVQIPVHLRVLGFDQHSTQSAIRVPLAFVLLVEADAHGQHIIQCGEGELVIKYADPARSLILLDAKPAQLVKGEGIGPPVGLIFTPVGSGRISGAELGHVFDIGDPGQEGVMHHQWILLLGIDDVELDEVGTLVQGGFEGLHSIFGQQGRQPTVGDVEGSALLAGVGGGAGQAEGQREQVGDEDQGFTFGHFGLYLLRCLLQIKIQIYRQRRTQKIKSYL